MIYKDIIETIKMIEEENLDIRTTTLGISLLDCFSDDYKKTSKKIYDKITSISKDLVKTANQVGDEFGISIVNKRLSVTPISLAHAKSVDEYLEIAKVLDKAAKDVGVDILGGYSALVQKGMTKSDEIFFEVFL